MRKFTELFFEGGFYLLPCGGVCKMFTKSQQRLLAALYALFAGKDSIRDAPGRTVRIASKD